MSIITAIACLGLGTPAFADTPTTTLKVEAAFDQTGYASGSLVKLTVTITNTGNVPAEKVTGRLDYSPTTFSPNVSGWGDLNYDKGVEVLPGETRVVNLAGYLNQPTTAVTAQGRILSPSRQFEPEPDFSLTAPVHTATGGWGGQVYGDANGNGTPDAGEGLAAVKVHLSGGVPWSEHVTTTDAAGTFSYTDLPTGRYFAYYELPGGWVVENRDGDVVVTEGTPGTVTVRTVRPLSDRLHVTIAFEQHAYQPGDTVHAKVTLTNSGATAINGIVAHCNGIGDANQLNAFTGWGPLVWNAGGVTLAAGETTVVDVAEAVPAAAQQWGEVLAGCEFGPGDGTAEGSPRAFDGARVAGVHGDVTVLVTQKGSSTGLPGVSFVIRDRYTHEVVAQPVTDANGKFHLQDTQVGMYDYQVNGPWKADDEWGGEPVIAIRPPNWNWSDEIVLVPSP